MNELLDNVTTSMVITVSYLMFKTSKNVKRLIEGWYILFQRLVVKLIFLAIIKFQISRPLLRS